MNKFINVVLLFVLFPTMLLTVFVGFDLPLNFLKTTGQFLPYKFEVFLGIGIFILILLLRRTVRRWMGIKIVTKTKKFKWNAAVSSARKKRVVTYLSLEAVIMLFLGTALYTVTNDAWAPAGAFLFGTIDSLLFIIIGLSKNAFRVGISSKALIVADREVTLLYFTGLRKVSTHQQTVYFDYIKDLQLSFPIDCVQEENQVEFFEILEAQFDPERVYFTKKK
ncbi:MAG: hypothetical protein ACKVJC_08945 [Flavobacteriales bacterium]|tara:strand:+ start:532 stop:1197 length:666 start_codon:yes stop_codon:yes gene_type:complete